MARKPTEKQLYTMKNELLRERFEQVTPVEFYRDVFPEGSLGERGNREIRRPNLIFTMTEQQKDRHYAFNTIVFDDLKELEAAQGAEFAVTSPVSYRGRNRTAANAHHLWGFCIDLDGVGMDQLRDLLFQIQNGVLPEPTYLVNSGHGFHVYYLLEEPIPLHKYLHQPLNNLKHGLTSIVWNAYTSNIAPEKRQYQGIFQGFRMPGTQSKLGKRYPVVAFRTGNKHTIPYLNDFVEDKYQLTEWNEYRLPLEEAKVKYPEWYQKVVVEGNKHRTKWDIAGKVHGDNPHALYDWWLDKLKAGAFDGNRYNCIATLMTYGVKCDVPKEKVLNDALELVPWLNSLTEKPKNAFTEKDVYDACTYFDDSYATYSIKAIEARTQIQIERNKRNGQKQADHLEEARAIRDIRMKRQGRKWDENNGRPKGSGEKSEIVERWRLQHPDGRKIDCERETGLSRHTVLKWWNMNDKQLYRYTDRQTMARLSREEQQKVARMIEKRMQEIAEQENISEEEAYEQFRKRNKEPDPLQVQADKLIFAESEMTPEFMMALAEKGIRNVQVVPDEEYETVMFEKYLQSLK